MFIQRVGPSPVFPARSPAAYRHTVFITQRNYIDMQSSFLFCCSVSAQEVDDMERVSEAVTKAVVFALKSTKSDDNNDDWLNPTEVANKYCDINDCLTSIAPWLLPFACVGAATKRKLWKTPWLCLTTLYPEQCTVCQKAKSENHCFTANVLNRV